MVVYRSRSFFHTYAPLYTMIFNFHLRSVPRRLTIRRVPGIYGLHAPSPMVLNITYLVVKRHLGKGPPREFAFGTNIDVEVRTDSSRRDMTWGTGQATHMLHSSILSFRRITSRNVFPFLPSWLQSRMGILKLCASM